MRFPEHSEGEVFGFRHTGHGLSRAKQQSSEVFQDITDHKKAQIMLEKLAVAVRQTADIVVITDKDGSIEYVNPAFEAQTGYKAEEAVGKTPRILKSGQQDISFYEGLWQMILAGEVFRSVLVNKKRTASCIIPRKPLPR